MLCWWGMLVTILESVHWFQPREWPNDSLLSFGLADVVLMVAGSLTATVGIVHQRRWAVTMVWSVAAVTWYPTLVCIATSLRTNEAWIASAMMISMAGLSLVIATIHGNASQLPATIRVAAMSRVQAAAWTIAQTVIFWSAFLWILPMGIVEMEHLLDWSEFQHSLQTPMAAGLFSMASILGLWSGLTMALRGDGTPLPTATAPRLVIAGPYRFVRNPMAVAGILQGLAVGWYLGSAAVIGYALLGAVLWHIVVRPVEEQDLYARFGDSYGDYRRRVGVWIPR